MTIRCNNQILILLDFVQQNRQLRLHHTFPYHQKESDKHKKIVDAIHSTSVNNFNNIIVYFLALRDASIF